MSITILGEITKPTKDGFQFPPCPISGCNCAVRFDFPTCTRTTLHGNIGDVLTIGTIAECNAGTKDIVQSVADSFVGLGWAVEV